MPSPNPTLGRDGGRVSSYGMYSRFLFLLFMGYERVLNSSDLFAMLRANILGVFGKPSPVHRLG